MRIPWNVTPSSSTRAAGSAGTKEEPGDSGSWRTAVILATMVPPGVPLMVARVVLVIIENRP